MYAYTDTPDKRTGAGTSRRDLDTAESWRYECPHGHTNLSARSTGARCGTCQNTYPYAALVDKRTTTPAERAVRRRSAMTDAETDASDDTCSFCGAAAVAAGTAENPLSNRTTAEIAVCATHLAALASAGTDACALGTGPADHTLPASVFGPVEIDGEEQYTGRWALCDDHFEQVAVPRGER